MEKRVYPASLFFLIKFALEKRRKDLTYSAFETELASGLSARFRSFLEGYPVPLFGDIISFLVTSSPIRYILIV